MRKEQVLEQRISTKKFEKVSKKKYHLEFEIDIEKHHLYRISFKKPYNKHHIQEFLEYKG